MSATRVEQRQLSSEAFIGLILTGLNEIFPMWHHQNFIFLIQSKVMIKKPSKIEENWRCRKAHSFQTIIWKTSIPKFDRTILKIESRLCNNFTSVYMILSEIYAVKERHGRAGSTLEMDSGHKKKTIDFYPRSLRPFLRILFVVNDSDASMQKELLVRFTRKLSAPSRRFARNNYVTQLFIFPYFFFF